MQVVPSFPHEVACPCGRGFQVPLAERRLVAQCDGCGRGHGPFELPAWTCKSDAADDIATHEYVMLDDQPGEAIVARLTRVGDAAKPWEWTEQTTALAVALVEQVVERWGRQQSQPAPQGVKPDANPRHLSLSTFALVQGFLALMERMDEAPPAVSALPVFGQLCEKVEAFPHQQAACFGEPLARRLLVSSIRLRPTLLKLEWLLGQRGEFRDDADTDTFQETVRWLATDPARPVAVRARAQESLREERRREEMAEQAEGASGRPRFLWLATVAVYGLSIGGIEGCGLANTANSASGFPDRVSEWQPLDLTTGLGMLFVMPFAMGFFAFLVLQWLFSPMAFVMSDAERVESTHKLKRHLLNAALAVPGAALTMALILIAHQVVSAMKGSLDGKSGGFLGAGMGVVGFLFWFGFVRWWAWRGRKADS